MGSVQCPVSSVQCPVCDQTTNCVTMAEGLGGVYLPSNTALRYLNGNVKVQAECDLPVGGHLRMKRTQEQMRGGRQFKLDLVESYNQYYLHTKRLNRDAKQMTCSGVRPKAGNEYKSPMDPIYYHQKQCALAFGPIFRSGKPGSGLGWMEPRMESFIGLVDRRKKLRGYIGGVKKRESIFAE